MNADPQLPTEPIRALLTEVGAASDFVAVPLPGGANNRAFRLDTGDQSFLLKAYFRHPDDPRDRLGTEFAFSRFAWERGIRALPQPFAADPHHALGLYAFVPGRAPLPEDVSAGAIDAALAFYDALNQHRSHPHAAELPDGSEACFRLDNHLQTVERRIMRLDSIQPEDALHEQARDFIQRDLRPLWEVVANEARSLVAHDPLPQEERRLSPSDFGFHNVIISQAGGLVFIDFEYAGWDDPAKLVCDFFCQPKVPVPMIYFDHILSVVTADSSQPDLLRQRIEVLLPVYRIKWCCIMLNHFLPVGGARRRFAGQGDAHKAGLQLEKARESLARVR